MWTGGRGELGAPVGCHPLFGDLRLESARRDQCREQGTGLHVRGAVDEGLEQRQGALRQAGEQQALQRAALERRLLQVVEVGRQLLVVEESTREGHAVVLRQPAHLHQAEQTLRSDRDKALGRGWL